MAGQDAGRADAALRLLLMQRDRIPGDLAPRGFRLDARAGAIALPATGFPLALVAGPTGPGVRTLVRLGPGGEAALRAAGAELGARAGDIVTARIPLAALPAVLDQPGILRLEAAPLLQPLGLSAGSDAAAGVGVVGDSANADARFDEIRRRIGDRWEGLAGQGVVVGIFDSGLDLAHDDFRGPDGRTRVLYAWDQTDSAGANPPGPVGPHAFGYGAECTADLIDDGGCTMVDRVGHGTHVAGIAAGDGSATGRGRPAYRFPGGAPAADIIVVKGGEGGSSGDLLVDGVAYIFARAEQLGRPAVVNVSLSGQFGPHDGSTLLEQALDALSGPGRIIVSGAGNAGDHRNTIPPVANGPNHAAGSGGAGTHALRIPPYAPADGAMNDGVVLEIWYAGADSLSVTLRSPRGDAISASTGDSAYVETAAGAVGILNGVGGTDPQSAKHQALIVIADADAAIPPDTGRWQIEVVPGAVHAGGDYHVWLAGWALDITAGRVPGLEGGTSNRFLVGVPASADRVLAAGAHVTREGWDGVEGPVLFEFRGDLGDIAYFSSPGPRVDRVQKPDLTAPGKLLISALSKDAVLWDRFPTFIESDSVHVALLGTSMASPQLAAAVAILLQIEPTLTPEQARDHLTLSAAADRFVPSVIPDPVWGHGKLDVAAAVRRLRPAGLAGDGEPINLSANPVRGGSLVISYPERPRSMAIYTITAERVRGFAEAELGPLTTIWPLDTDQGGPAANGLYVLVVELTDRRVLRKLLVARP